MLDVFRGREGGGWGQQLVVMEMLDNTLATSKIVGDYLATTLMVCAAVDCGLHSARAQC